jgi:propionyl-CoA carboxylase alpha chain
MRTYAPITRLLVANRGEIASRVFRTCRGLGIGTVAVHSEADAALPFVREADRAVALPGNAPAETYLRIDAVIAAALTAGADAVHPGYGFLAENPAFAQRVIEAGLVWVGPSPEAIRAMGSKIGARDLMSSAGVPVLLGEHLGAGTSEELEQAGRRIGFPLLVKASAGGGGRGIRAVQTLAELDPAVQGAQSEAASAFGDPTVFLERYVPSARHVEIQIIGDSHGRVVALGERDCSVQRRHQKVIEEAPSPAVDGEVRAAMSDAAVAAGQALSYEGAGTVEFLLTPEGEFFFLEVNTRLQVEHAVTELVTGIDLVALQILVAEGAALPTEIGDAPPAGHAVEARLYAEDAARGFLPSTGTLARFSVGPDVRVDASVESGSTVSPYYDPMLAKVVAHGPTREAAIRKLADALARAELHGVVTNRDLLVRVLRHEEFVAGQADTSFLDRVGLDTLARPLLDQEQERWALAATALAAQARSRRDARVLARAPSGWRNVPTVLQERTFEAPTLGQTPVRYRLDRGGRVEVLEVGDVKLDVTVADCQPELVALVCDGVCVRHRVHLAGNGVAYVNTSDGQASFGPVSRHPARESAQERGALTSPVPGTVTRVLADVSSMVSVGQPLLVIEAMKMEHEIVAATDGELVALHVGVGEHVEAATPLATISPVEA